MDKELINLILRPKLEKVIEECEKIAYLIKLLHASDEQCVIEYEDVLNYYSNIDYNKINRDSK